MVIGHWVQMLKKSLWLATRNIASFSSPSTYMDTGGFKTHFNQLNLAHTVYTNQLIVVAFKCSLERFQIYNHAEIWQRASDVGHHHSSSQLCLWFIKSIIYSLINFFTFYSHFSSISTLLQLPVGLWITVEKNPGLHHDITYDFLYFILKNGTNLPNQ